MGLSSQCSTMLIKQVTQRFGPCTPFCYVRAVVFCFAWKESTKGQLTSDRPKPTIRFRVHPGVQPSVTPQFVWGTYKHISHSTAYNSEGKVPDSGLWRYCSITDIIEILFQYYHVSVINTMNSIHKCLVKHLECIYSEKWNFQIHRADQRSYKKKRLILLAFIVFRINQILTVHPWLNWAKM